MKKVLLSLALAVAVSLSMAPTTLAKELKTSDYVAEFGQPEDESRFLNVRGFLTIHDKSPQEVFAFVSNLENDTLLYPGTLSAVRVSGDGGVGTVYEETIFFGGVLSDITATILEYKQDHWLKFKADNLLNNVSSYSIKKQGSNTVLELESFVYVPEGVTQNDMEVYMSYVFQNMLAVFNTTGEINI